MLEKIIKKEEDLFIPQTERAKKLLKKIEQFNELADYFKSKEAIDILSNDLNIKAGEKYAQCDEKKPSKVLEYISPGKFSVEYESGFFNEKVEGRAFIKIDMVPVRRDGTIGKKFVGAYTKRKDNMFRERFHLKKLEKNFVPSKRKEFLFVEDAMKIIGELDNENKSSLRLFNAIKESFAKNGIEMDFQLVREMPSNNIYVSKVWMLSESKEKLHEEACKIYTPFLLNRDERIEKRVDELLKTGYADRMIITKVKKDFNEYIESIKGDLELRFGFGCSSCVMWHNSTLGIWSKPKNGVSGGNEWDVHYYNKKSKVKPS